MSVPSPKVVVVGDTGVGKTAVIGSIRKLPFDAHAPQTVGSASWRVQRSVDAELSTFELWDTAGQDAYASLVPFYIRDAKVVLFCFSLTDSESLDAVPRWVELVTDRETVPCLFVVGNKADCPPSVTEDAVNQIAERINAPYFEVSAKSGKGIEELTVEIIRGLKRLRADDRPAAPLSVLRDESLNAQPASTKHSHKARC
jgi:small GTP-binding protein